MQAIRTRYFGPTNTQPSRILATTGNGRFKVVHKYDDSISDNHEVAAKALMAKMNWPNEIIGGGYGQGEQYWVMIPTNMVLAPKVHSGLFRPATLLVDGDEFSPRQVARMLAARLVEPCRDTACPHDYHITTGYDVKDIETLLVEGS